MEMLSPAQRHRAKAVRAADCEIGREAIRVVPSDVDFEAYSPPFDTEELEDVVINFHVHNLDRSEKWAGTIPTLAKAAKPFTWLPILAAKHCSTKGQ